MAIRDKIRLECYSAYYRDLSAEAKERYVQKVAVSGLNRDPYAIESGWIDDPASAPNVQWSDLVIYMAKTPSPSTGESIKVTSLVVACDRGLLNL